MKDIVETAREMITRALAHTEAILAAEWERQLNAQLDEFRAQLEKDGMDAKISFGFPRTTLSKAGYARQIARRNYCEKMTRAANPNRWANHPDIRVYRDGVREDLKAEAARDAKDSLAGFIGKMEGKIAAQMTEGTTVTKVTYCGGLDPWSHSQIRVRLSDGNEQVWRTRMILNVSCLGLVFNQWPTRLAA